MRLVANINPEWCDKSPGCPASQACPQGAISQEMGDGKKAWNPFALPPLKVDPEKCTGCGLCASICPHGAIQLVEFEEENGKKAAGL